MLTFYAMIAISTATIRGRRIYVSAIYVSISGNPPGHVHRSVHSHVHCRNLRLDHTTVFTLDQRRRSSGLSLSAPFF